MMKWLHRFFAQLSRGFGLSRSLAPLRGMVRRLWVAGPARLLVAAGRWVLRAFWNAVRWVASLDYRLFLQGLPALAALLAAVAVTVIVMSTPAQDIESRYSEQAKAAMRSKNYPDALACYERLAQLQHDRPEVIYDMAIAAGASGNPERCQLLMQQLAGPDKLGYPKAHFWNAVKLMVSPGDPVQNRQLAEAHLLLALAGGYDDREAAHGFLGELYLAKGISEQAERHLLIAVKTKVELRMRLAYLYFAQGNTARARTEALQAIDHYSTAVKADLFNHFARIKWSEGLIFLKDFPQAIHVLEEGLSGTGEDLYRKALAEAFLAWFDYLTFIGNVNPGLRLDVMERGLQYDPKNVALLDRLLSLTGIKSEPPYSPLSAASLVSSGSGLHGQKLAVAALLAHRPLAAEARSILQRLLAAGHVTAQVHFILGTDAWEHDRTAEARVHWERALELSPNLPVVANNLAWLIYKTEPNKLDKALELVNLAITKSPTETNFRDTRGHILAKMASEQPDRKSATAKLKEALADLEAALPRTPNAEGLHRALADVYDRLDVPGMAAEHRQLAEQAAARKQDKK